MLTIIEAAEVFAKLSAFGPKRFLHCAEYEDEAGRGRVRVFEQWENRTALALTAGTLVAWIVARATSSASGLGYTSGENLRRLALVLPTLRLFFVVKTARRVVFVLVPLRYYIASAVGLMLTFTYM